jgi:AcrR family transcriptional regulator
VTRVSDTAGKLAAVARRTAARSGGQPRLTAGARPGPALRRDAVRNYELILEAARQVFGESGADACMEEIAARAGVGIGTVYRRFASKDALIDELLQLALDQLISAADRALTCAGGTGLEELLRAFGQSFADHAGYANLLLERQPDAAAAARLRDGIAELTRRAAAAGTIGTGVTGGDVLALVWALRGLVQTAGDVAPEAWQRFLTIHLAGLRGAR